MVLFLATAQPVEADQVDKWLEVFCRATAGVYWIELGRCERPGRVATIALTYASLEEYLADNARPGDDR